jgi:predicted Zn finger-like uncharacterized protein
MDKPHSEPFECPNCAAQYKVVRIEAVPANDREITCRNCGGPLHGRHEGFFLKYFLVKRPGERKQPKRIVRRLSSDDIGLPLSRPVCAAKERPTR